MTDVVELIIKDYKLVGETTTVDILNRTLHSEGVCLFFT